MGNRLQEFTVTTGRIQNGNLPVGAEAVRQTVNYLLREVSGQQRGRVVNAVRLPLGRIRYRQKRLFAAPRVRAPNWQGRSMD